MDKIKKFFNRKKKPENSHVRVSHITVNPDKQDHLPTGDSRQYGIFDTPISYIHQKPIPLEKKKNFPQILQELNNKYESTNTGGRNNVREWLDKYPHR